MFTIERVMMNTKELVGLILVILVELVFVHMYRTEQARLEKGLVRVNKYDWMMSFVYYGLIIELVAAMVAISLMNLNKS